MFKRNDFFDFYVGNNVPGVIKSYLFLVSLHLFKITLKKSNVKL